MAATVVDIAGAIMGGGGAAGLGEFSDPEIRTYERKKRDFRHLDGVKMGGWGNVG